MPTSRNRCVPVATCRCGPESQVALGLNLGSAGALALLPEVLVLLDHILSHCSFVGQKEQTTCCASLCVRPLGLL